MRMQFKFFIESVTYCQKKKDTEERPTKLQIKCRDQNELQNGLVLSESILTTEPYII